MGLALKTNSDTCLLLPNLLMLVCAVPLFKLISRKFVICLNALNLITNKNNCVNLTPCLSFLNYNSVKEGKCERVCVRVWVGGGSGETDKLIMCLPAGRQISR